MATGSLPPHGTLSQCGSMVQRTRKTEMSPLPALTANRNAWSWVSASAPEPPGIGNSSTAPAHGRQHSPLICVSAPLLFVVCFSLTGRYLATKPLADDGTPVACDNGLREPSRETLKPWMLPVPGVRTYRNRESLLIAASSGVLPVPVFPV